MNPKKIETLIRFAKEYALENLTALGDCLSVREGKGMLVTDPAKPLGAITADDIREVSNKDTLSETEALHLSIYAAYPEIGAVAMNHAPYCAGIAANCKKLPAVLDDLAQIIGPNVRVAKSAEPSEIFAAINGRSACIIRNGTVVAIGRTLDEAHTGSLVLEKGAKAYIEGTVLGGAFKIGLLDTIIMHFGYKVKYSKKDQDAKKAELSGEAKQ